MKSFKEYLAESKKVYEFKVRIAGDCPKDCSTKVKTALSEFHVTSVGACKDTPIQETQIEFPEHKNISLTIFDVSTSYPATSAQVRDKIAEALKLAHSCVKVRTFAEEQENAINYQHAAKSGKSLLSSEYEASNNQELVGDKHAMSLLKELSKTKHQGTQIKGTNDELLADSEPAEKTAKVKTIDKKSGTVSTIGTKKMSIPDPFKRGK